METEAQSAGLPELEKVRRDIEEWRKSRPKLEPMPAQLWSDAAALARGQGVGPVARALSVSFGSLQKQVGLGGRKAGRPRGTTRARPASFVEINGVAPRHSRPAENGAVVEVVASDGARLTIRLGDGATDVAAWVQAFRGQR